MAILTKQQLLDQTNAKIQANGARLITGVVLNDVLIDLIDSVQIGGGVGLNSWSAAIQYSTGDCVVSGSQIYQAIGTPTIGVFNAVTEWNLISKSDVTVTTISQRNSLTVKFVGMTCHVTGTNETFRLVGGTATANWKKNFGNGTIKIRVGNQHERTIDVSNNGHWGTVSHLEINGVRYELTTDFTWNGSDVEWLGLFPLETTDQMFLIHEK